MKLLHSYLNGNVHVKLFDDGTKIQEWDGDSYSDAKPEFPNSMDVKITNYCDLECKFCHEKSGKYGKHADLDYLLTVLKDLPAGTELAIGGGNPLSHPKLREFLEECKKLSLICNMTINYKHLFWHIGMINSFIDQKLIYGLGISVDSDSDLNMVYLLSDDTNVVFHVISGVESIDILDRIYESPVHKVLILGYKEFGRGIKFYNAEVEDKKTVWHTQISKYFKKLQLTFDDLGAKQFDMQQYFSKERWESMFTGFDGQFTMYIDAVKKEFAVSSTGKDRFALDKPIKECFKQVRILSGNE